MAPPRLVRRGEASRISDEFARAFEGRLTTVEGVDALRQRLLGLCITGDGSIDWTGVGALKTHVDLDEALIMEGLRTAAGDARHVFQEWYPKYSELRRKQGQRDGAHGTDTVDPAEAARELAMIRQAIQETEDMLTAHRLAVLDGVASPFTDADVDTAHAVLESMRANERAFIEASQGIDEESGR